MHHGRNACYLLLLVAVLAAGWITDEFDDRCHESTRSENEEDNAWLRCRGAYVLHNRFLTRRDLAMKSGKDGSEEDRAFQRFPPLSRPFGDGGRRPMEKRKLFM
nr:uncharacterized protein LOC129386155 [Dermacentor andersoni]